MNTAASSSIHRRPSGTVTFLFTDIEGSTKLWQAHPDAMPVVLARHHALLHQSIAAHNGYVFQIVGDAFCAAFATAAEAVDAALEAQRALRDEAWGETPAPRVRMALHTGVADVRAGEYTSGEYVSGITLSRAARLLSAGHGGQILLSSPAAELVREQLPSHTALRDLGAHRLKDLVQPQQIFQFIAPDLPADFPPLKTVDTLPNNLPIQLTSFIGRDKEIGALNESLGRGRLVTLTGPGGAGKTRLALQVAAEVIETFENGAWFVDLAPLSDPALVPNAVMSALDLREQAGRDPLDALTDYLYLNKLLLLLDNCEHLIDASARLTHHLLTHCPDLKILATSREGLNLAGEVVYPVPPLSVPDLRHLPPLESLSQYEAVRLFIERAIALQPQFAVTNANAPAVAQICWRLDGLPLAIELAAARIKLFGPEQIATRLDDRFRLLAGGSRTALPRQQSLRATVEWSYSLLSDSERTLFRRLSVFAGGWTIEAAEQVCAAEGSVDLDPLEVMDLLARLVDKSLVTTEAREGATRYRMLESIREYAFDELREAGQVEPVRRRHRNYFLAFAESANRCPISERPEWIARLEVDHDNLRGALRWTLEENESEQALAFCNALDLLWGVRGYWTESRAWFAQAIASSRQLQANAQVSRAHRAQYGEALDINGTRAVHQGDYVSAREQLDEALSVKRELGDKAGIASVLIGLGNLAWYQDDAKGAASFWGEALAFSRELGNKSDVAYLLWMFALLAKERGDYAESQLLSQESLTYHRELNQKEGAAWVLENLAWLEMIAGDYAKSQQFAEEVIAVRQETGNRFGLASAFNTIGYLAWHQGDCRAARESLKEGLAIFRKLETSSFMTCLSLSGFAIVDVTEGHLTRGTRLLGAIHAESERTGRYNKDIFLDVYNKALERARAALAPEAFAAAWAEGLAMTIDQAVELAMKDEK